MIGCAKACYHCTANFPKKAIGLYLPSGQLMHTNKKIRVKGLWAKMAVRYGRFKNSVLRTSHLEPHCTS